MAVYTNPRPNRIVLETRQRRTEEKLAAEALSPGHLVELLEDGTVQKNARTGEAAEKLVALEDALQGNTIDDAYSEGDLVSMILADPGDRVMLRMATGISISKGDALQSAGDGTVETTSGTTPLIVLAYAMEDRDNTEGSDEIFVKARIA